MFRKKLEKGKKYRRLVFDIECDGLLEELTKMHCFVAFDLDNKVWIKHTDVAEAVKELNNDYTIVIGHFITNYDLPALRKLSGIDIKPAKVIDTLPITQYLYPDDLKHGLDEMGKKFGIEKPKIEDWNSLTVEEYLHRCTEDVKINTKLYDTLISKLITLYDNDTIMVDELISYLTFKFECLEEQYRNPVTLDFELLFKEMLELSKHRDQVKSELITQMPKVVKMGIKKKPKVYYKKDGNLSSAAEKWEAMLQEAGYSPEEAELLEEVEVVASVDDPNPDSNEQLKDWFFSLGWQPCTFKYTLDKVESDRQRKRVFKSVPQISMADDKTKLTPSVLRLAEKNESIALLAGYSTLKHRVTILEGFLRDSINGKLPSEASGITNTMRLKHRVIVNLPKPNAAYAEHIRECLMAPEGYYMVGADLSGIEDNTKQHYIFPLDPDYVNSMRTPGFDAHIRIGVLANLISEEDEEFYKAYDKADKEEREKFPEGSDARFKTIKLVRGDAKIVNFSATYGVGAKTLARNGGFSESFAQKLLDTYWELNWAVKEFAENREVQVLDGQKWVRQPVSGFWYSLRADKDRFSTVNQSTAVYVFDLWVKFLREEGIQITLQYHDEVMFLVKNEITQEETTDKVLRAMSRVNELLKLNIEVKCSLDFGKNYKEVH